MKLERVTAELRPRETWEASDFGARLVRRDAGKIYFVWFAVTLPLIAASVAAIWLTPWAAFIAPMYWWLEPVADGPILHLISRRLFGENVTGKDALRQTLRLAWQNRLFLLTPFRFHAARSVAMPVTQLEGLAGSERRKRSAVINNHAFRHGTGLTIVYQHIALAVYLGLIVLVFLFIPEQYHDSLGEGWFSMFAMDASPMSATVGLLVVYAAQSSLQPWFVGAGFGLYINCRTRLEAWDIEVAFRRMLERRSQRIGNGRVAATVVVIALFAALSPPDNAHAQSEEPPDEVSVVDELDYTAEVTADPGFAGYWTREEVQPAVDVVEADERFDLYEEREVWIDKEDDEIEVDDEPSGVWEVFRSIGELIAVLVEFSLWIGVGLLLLFLYSIRDRWLPYLQRGRAVQRARRRVVLAGGEVTEESLPDDVPGEARRLWATGRLREAMALLYRGSVFAAVRRHGIRLPTSATEGDCMRAVEQQGHAPQRDYFRRLVSAWLRCAYGGSNPDESLVFALCDEWPGVYGEPS